MRRHAWILAAAGLFLGACDDAPVSGGSGADAGPDIIEGGSLSITESDLTAEVGAQATALRLALSREGRGSVDAEAVFTVYPIDGDEALAEVRVPFTADAPMVTVEAALDFGVPEALEAPESLGQYVIEYAVLRGGGQLLWGRRSLFAAQRQIELQVLSTDAFPVGASTQLQVFARDPASGRPLADTAVTVALRRADGIIAEREGRTDEHGYLAVPLEAGEDAETGDAELVVAVEGEGGQAQAQAGVAVERPTKVLVTTDKPLYQPGQTMHLRALALRRPALVADAGQPVVFEVFDGKDNKVERVTAETDDFGIASTTFTLAREVNMGRYRIAVTVGETLTEKTVTVERYSLPKYDLDLELDQGVYLAGDTLRGVLKARYFFGQPVQQATVRLAASTLDVGQTVFAELQGMTNDDGLYSFEVQLPDYIVGLPLEQGGGLVQLALSVTDSAGQSRDVARTVRVARGALEVVVVPETGTLVSGAENRLLVRCTDAAGAPAAASHTLALGGQDVAQFETGADGLAQVAVQIDQPVAELRITSVDDAGNEVVTETRLNAIDGVSQGAVLVRTDQALYRVGDSVEVEVEQIGQADRVFLALIADGRTLLTTALDPDPMGLARHTIDLAPDHQGALQIEAFTLSGGASLRRDAALVYVEPANALDVRITSDRDLYAPAEEATLTFQVTDEEGAGRPTAIGLQVVDEAVFSLVEFQPGLERTYFFIEGALAEPRYQVGVPGLATLTAQPGATDDAEVQGEARLLMAATDPRDAHPVNVNTFALAQQRVVPIVTPAIEALANGFFEGVRDEYQGDEEAVRARLDSGENTPYDPFGQRTLVSLDGNTVRFVSKGPDERLDTVDDVTVTRNVWQVVYGDEPNFAGGAGGAGGGAPPPQPGGAPEDDGNVADRDGQGEGEGGGGVRVRRNFPETLLVEPALITDADGVAQLTLPLADSITTWRVSALANTAMGQLGSTSAGVTVFQDFFVDIDFPATLTRGDEFHVPVAVYNYLDRPQTVRLEVQEAPWLSLLGDAALEIELGPGEVGGVRIPVVVQTVGLHELTIIARGDDLADGVARTVLVEPDGQQVENVESGRLEGTVRHTVEIPELHIEGSGRLLVKIYPGLFSSLVEGLDALLRMPSGCFEQTSSTTWPNALVMSYMRETGSGSPELDATASQYVNTGYQRLLTFEVTGGGFEWFGNTPAHIVLTAYGLMEFADLARVRTVDEQMVARTRSWVIGQQKADGSWEVATRGLDETGQLTDPVTVTAYVAFGLAVSAPGQQDPALDQARDFLAGRVDDMGTYTLALFANFLVAYQPGQALTNRIVDQLAEAVQEAVENVPVHWETDEQTTTYGAGEAAWIETTALATHALLVSGRAGGVSQEALNWLVSKKDARGGWGSTAGTVWTMKCLLAALQGAADEDANATVHVRMNGEERATFQVTPENSDVMRQADLSELFSAGVPHDVEIEIEGEGRLQYALVHGFHQPWTEAPPPEGPLSIEVTYDRTDLAVDDTVEVTVRVANNDLTYADMVMVDLGIPPGFDLVTSDLDALVQQGVFSRYERTERQLLIYFTVIRPENPVEFSYHLVARDPIRAQAPRSRIYSYYNEEVGAEAEPIDIEVQ